MEWVEELNTYQMRRRSVFSAVNCESDRVALNLSLYHAKLLSYDRVWAASFPDQSQSVQWKWSKTITMLYFFRTSNENFPYGIDKFVRSSRYSGYDSVNYNMLQYTIRQNYLFSNTYTTFLRSIRCDGVRHLYLRFSQWNFLKWHEKYQ